MLLALLMACPGDKNDEASGPSCEDTPSSVAIDEVTPLGFAAADLVAFVEGDTCTAWAESIDIATWGNLDTR